MTVGGIEKRKRGDRETVATGQLLDFWDRSRQARLKPFFIRPNQISQTAPQTLAHTIVSYTIHNNTDLIETFGRGCASSLPVRFLPTSVHTFIIAFLTQQV